MTMNDPKATLSFRLGRGLAASLLAVLLSVPALAQDEETTPPDRPQTPDTNRVFLDTQVFSVAVDDMMTYATLAQAPESECPMDGVYVYERARPKWLYQTGRLLQAQREEAIVRVSFSCVDGVQTINAMQFLSPPPSRMARGMPGREDSVEVRAGLPVSRVTPTLSVPLPTPASATRDIETVPQPR